MYNSWKKILAWFKGQMLNRMHNMITCKEFEEFIIEYLDGELPARQREIFEFHMRICRECREYLAAYNRTIEISRASFDSARNKISDEVPEDIIKAILKAKECD
jgi:anti-sigma factor RsiW